ncbi:alpha/beta hydrolase [Kribbella sp. NBC_00709]|uniref:alpha/beta fold hydrolase n=1 Tax=Kribbella sp. NBC_00709 TaxID=2975972 RepID=UPI002E2CB3FC|nr:alpha/beta hydrolase [Kribbella sp. NBC_00709]
MDVDERFEWKGRSIAWGKAGSGPAVVFCHGTPFSSRVWSRYADALSADFTVYLWDMPGYGESAKHHEVDFGSQAKAFAALLEHWELDRPHVVAHDFGGAVSLRATLAEKAAYRSLMLVDVVAVPPSGSPFFQFVKRHPTTLDELPAYIHEAILRAYVSAASHRGLREAELDELVKPWLTAEGQPAFYRQIAQYDEQYLVENERILGNLAIPVKVVWGRDDAWIPTATGKRLADLIPGASYVEVPEAGHLIQYDAPVALATLLRDWLSPDRCISGDRKDLSTP